MRARLPRADDHARVRAVEGNRELTADPPGLAPRRFHSRLHRRVPLRLAAFSKRHARDNGHHRPRPPFRLRPALAVPRRRRGQWVMAAGSSCASWSRVTSWVRDRLLGHQIRRPTSRLRAVTTRSTFAGARPTLATSARVWPSSRRPSWGEWRGPTAPRPGRGPAAPARDTTRGRSGRRLPGVLLADPEHRGDAGPAHPAHRGGVRPR